MPNAARCFRLCHVLLFHRNNRDCGNDSLNHAVSEDNLSVRPALVLSEMVVQGSADFFECVDVKKSNQRNLSYSEQTVKANHKAERNNKKNVAALENADAQEKPESS